MGRKVVLRRRPRHLDSAMQSGPEIKVKNRVKVPLQVNFRVKTLNNVNKVPGRIPLHRDPKAAVLHFQNSPKEVRVHLKRARSLLRPVIN